MLSSKCNKQFTEGSILKYCLWKHIEGLLFKKKVYYQFLQKSEVQNLLIFNMQIAILI